MGGKTDRYRFEPSSRCFVGSSGWIAGEGGLILHTPDGGVTWNRQNSNTLLWLETVCFINAKTGWAAGEGGAIVSTTDGGATWTKRESGTRKWMLASHLLTRKQAGQSATTAGTQIIKWR